MKKQFNYKVVHENRIVSRHSVLKNARNRAANLKRRFEMDCSIEPIGKAKDFNSVVSDSIQAIENSIPWMILLGDFIGNGTKEKPFGRCAAILRLHEAIKNLKKINL